MLSFPASVRICVALGATDMRKSFDGLCGVVQDMLGENAFSGHVFAFCNRRRTILKMLVWDRSGFFLFAKRLEQGTYALAGSRSGRGLARGDDEGTDVHPGGHRPS